MMDARLALRAAGQQGGHASVAVLADTAASAGAREGRASDEITINGRFYTQPTTGVQRYGRQIVAALDPILQAAGRTARLVVPPGQDPLPSFDAIRAQRSARLRGHPWEQAVLAAAAGPLLNLCNTAPALRRRQLVCIHDTNVLTQPDSYRRSFRLFYRLLQPLLARRSATVTTVSKASALALARHLPLKLADIAVLPNGHEHALTWEPRRSRFWGDGVHRRPFVLLLGSRAKHKNVGLIVRLAPALDEVGLDLVIAGGGSSIFADADTKSAPSPANIRVLGSVSDDDLAALFAQALCLAFPSLTEGFGLPIVEAMALGCPVISSDRASMPEICGAAALMAAPDDPAAWLTHVKTLLASQSLRDELRDRGREQVRRFSWRASAQGYFDRLERLA